MSTFLTARAGEGASPNKALQRSGAFARLRIERLESSMSRSFDETVRLARSAPAAEGHIR